MRRVVTLSMTLLLLATGTVLIGCKGGSENMRQTGNAHKLDLFHQRKKVR